MRILVTVLCGALLALIFGAVVVRDRAFLNWRSFNRPRVSAGRMRRLLTVEEAARWRPAE
jgi:hypothetical protein